MFTQVKSKLALREIGELKAAHADEVRNQKAAHADKMDALILDAGYEPRRRTTQYQILPSHILDEVTS